MRVPTMPMPGSQDVVHLGLTFSFPVEQTALGAGKILTWTKGFAAKNAIGHDVVQLLQDAFDRKHLHVKCVALVNDVRIRIPRGERFEVLLVCLSMLVIFLL